MFNEAPFQKISPIIGSINDYAVHIYRKYMYLEGNNITCGPG